MSTQGGNELLSALFMDLLLKERTCLNDKNSSFNTICGFL